MGSGADVGRRGAPEAARRHEALRRGLRRPGRRDEGAPRQGARGVRPELDGPRTVRAVPTPHLRRGRPSRPELRGLDVFKQRGLRRLPLGPRPERRPDARRRPAVGPADARPPARRRPNGTSSSSVASTRRRRPSRTSPRCPPRRSRRRRSSAPTRSPAAAATTPTRSRSRPTTLWDVRRTAPYFRDGSVKSLEDAVRAHMTRDARRRRQRGPDRRKNSRRSTTPESAARSLCEQRRSTRPWRRPAAVTCPLRTSRTSWDSSIRSRQGSHQGEGIEKEPMMNVRKTPLIAAALAALVCAAPALAHGWPLPGVGGGTQSFTGAAGPGGGGGTETSRRPAAALRPACRRRRSSTPPSPRPTSSRARRRRRAAAARRFRRRASAPRLPTKGKGGAMPVARPHPRALGAGVPALDRRRWLRGPDRDRRRRRSGSPPSEGGWSRDQRPVMVFSYDATNAEHRRLLATLDTDGRVRTASHFFNCFRVDVGAAAEKSQANDARLSVFTRGRDARRRDHRPAQALGGLRPHRVRVAAPGRLRPHEQVAKMDGFLKTKAYAEHFIPLCEAGIVCPDCGHERLDFDRARRRAAARASTRAIARIDELRIVAKN